MLKKVFLGSKVSSIENEAFYHCVSLETVDCNGTAVIENIGSDAFSECSNLQNVDLGNKLNRIGEYAFYECNSLTEIDLKNCADLETICSRAFLGCLDVKIL